MSIRIYQPCLLTLGQLLQLTPDTSHHLAHVLRVRIADSLSIFNGEGGEYAAVITEINKKNVTVLLKEYLSRTVESPLQLSLVQGISRGEKMDFTIQKAVELGVHTIIPLLTERSSVKLEHERLEKRLQHWQSIAIHAAQQSGRNQITKITAPQTLSSFLNEKIDYRFILSPHAHLSLKTLSLPPHAKVALLIGPEGGFTDTELDFAIQKGCICLNLGPRILRTETAALASITALQCYFGDLT